MKSKKGSTNYTIHVNGQRYQTTSIRRFYTHIRTIKWQNRPSIYLRVSYGPARDVFGKIQNFYNDADITNKKDFDLTLKAFLEL